MKILHLHLKRKYWEQIRDGKKDYEYRERNAYWFKRLLFRSYDLIYLYMGYPKRGDMSKILIRKWMGYKVGEIEHEQFGKKKKVHAFWIDVTFKLNKKED